MDELAQRPLMIIRRREYAYLKNKIMTTEKIANSRQTQLVRSKRKYRATLQQLEKLKMNTRQPPESIIVDTPKYKCLQSKFSVVYNDNLKLRATLDKTKQHLSAMLTNHLKHIEQMESAELLAQKKFLTDMIQMEDVLSQVRKEYQMLRTEFEQNLAASKHTCTINREMRHLITSLQTHNQQLQGDAHRYRKKYKEVCTENTKLKHQKDELEIRINSYMDKESISSNASMDDYQDEEDSPTSSCIVLKEKRTSESSAKKSDGDSPNEATSNTKGDKMIVESPIKEMTKDMSLKGSQVTRMKSESECIKELRSQLKKALNDQREMNLLLDMYKEASKDQRDKVQLMASERKSRQELDEVKQTRKKLQENKKEERKKLADEDAMKRIKSLEQQIHGLQRQVTVQKQEEEVLISEMEVTGQAFEDMQEQNSRLIQQLREKDDANFKLMSDRIQSNQLQKLAREERELLQEQVSTLSNQVEAQKQVVHKLEEKERLLLNNISSMEQEAILRRQATELHKQKALESAQSAADLKLHLEKYHSQLKNAQQADAENTSGFGEIDASEGREKEVIVIDID